MAAGALAARHPPRASTPVVTVVGESALFAGPAEIPAADVRWEIADPWILLTAAALATRRIRLGTAVTPVARRRPSKLAREVTTLDRLTAAA